MVSPGATVVSSEAKVTVVLEEAVDPWQPPPVHPVVDAPVRPVLEARAVPGTRRARRMSMGRV